MSIDEMAFRGYEYALSGASMPDFETEMDLLAFNAGISNANIKNGLNVEKILSVNISYIAGRPRASDKELSITWGQN
ncbi:MAG: hypothetical protein QM500_19780 [Methylococcales bacterium]